MQVGLSVGNNSQLTWYLVSSVLHTPVSNIKVTSTGISVGEVGAMVVDAVASLSDEMRRDRLDGWERRG